MLVPSPGRIAPLDYRAPSPLEPGPLALVPLGTRRAMGVVMHIGRQTHVWDATVTNETTGRTMALVRCTQMVLPPR